ncbi:phosphoenolpyruvate--protein phosphotransferase [Haloarcula salinisoli]|uniref:Phosphoenolpyruvate-protein phosphotransferase n=1 Tax=Haloarcula salinisoli TaxID=2487746 RepID=A0A8J7YRC3_9EURY|nr:phosphoenolpyruvate--protein phosphotransferase [Halomicroarcula salinisoli]MBX0288434.1 phosphoenolpyruvate--protein phosphotransferase [Halomicroarcula salinisoli]MBX0305918.1 phosphoenolpyruvate--protein phosphotransferase [Halomicroarcula salinisoli]
MAASTLTGTGATPRSGLGTVVWYDPEITLPDADESVDVEAERDRFADAVDTARAELERERDATAERVGEDEAAIFDAHIQFLEDPTIEEAVVASIEEGRPAAHAVDDAFGVHIEQFEGMEGRMAERADDLRDVRDRLLRLLTGGDRVNLADLPEGSVVLAERLTPSDTAQLDPETVAGFATVTGGRTSHAAIFARSLALPAVVGLGEALNDVSEGTEVVVDGDAGELLVGPDEAEREAARAEEGADVVEESVETSDGREIEVAANVGRPAELEPAAARGADGVGLYRTEFLFLDRQSPPDEDEQYETVRDALDTFPDGRVVVRTLDIGGDKQIPYLDLPEEENPFLGERGIRRSLDPDAELFRTQLRALLRAAADGAGELNVMFPLVATVEELEAAIEAVDDAAADLADRGVDHERPSLGVMVETPSAVFMADEFARRVDFLSIGTNDLTQYVMAADRENERVGDLHDPTHPGVVRAIGRTVEQAHANDAWVGMCGEMAGNPDVTELLVGLGLDELSMSAVTVPDVKVAVSETEYSAARERADSARRVATRSELHETIQ